MRQDMRTMIVFALLYAAFAAVGLGPLFGAGGFNDATFGIALVIAIALFPFTAIVLTMFSHIFLRPPRERVAAPEAARRAAEPAPERDHFDFAFAAWNGIESAEAVARLSRRLHALDIAHQFSDGQISVTEGDVRWKVAPVVGALRIAGWVEAPDRETRAMIEAAVEEFLIDELGISLEKLAA
jgi:FAD/FMN-containing dehydrogenase